LHDVLRTLDVKSILVFPGENGKQRRDFKGPWQRIRKAGELLSPKRKAEVPTIDERR
jgi:hypothetical protein